MISLTCMNWLRKMIFWSQRIFSLITSEILWSSVRRHRPPLSLGRNTHLFLLSEVEIQVQESSLISWTHQITLIFVLESSCIFLLVVGTRLGLLCLHQSIIPYLTNPRMVHPLQYPQSSRHEGCPLFRLKSWKIGLEGILWLLLSLGHHIESIFSILVLLILVSRTMMVVLRNLHLWTMLGNR